MVNVFRTENAKESVLKNPEMKNKIWIFGKFLGHFYQNSPTENVQMGKK